MEFPWDGVRSLITADKRFTLEQEQWRQCMYKGGGLVSMMRTQYDCIFFTAKKSA
jgi:hypothetical protein